MLLLWRVIARSLVTRGRIVGLGLLALLGLLLAAAARDADHLHRHAGGAQLIQVYGLGVLVPVASLVFAAAALGDLAEDATLVYLWLRPVRRSALAVAALLAALSVALPAAVVPVVAMAAILGEGWRLVGGTAVGAAVAAIAYCAVFSALGLRVRRALAWGLAYLVIWEEAVARVSGGAAHASIFVAASSLAAHLAHLELPPESVSVPVGIAFPLVLATVALLVTTRWLNRAEVA